MGKTYKVALVTDNVVENVIIAQADFQPGVENCTMVFLAEVEDGKPDVILHEGVMPGPGFLWDGVDFSPPDLPEEQLLEIAKQCRKAVARKIGVSFKGCVVEASLKTIETLKELLVTLELSGLSVVSFKLQDGFLELGVADTKALLRKVRVEVQRLFTLESHVSGLVKAGKIKKAMEVESLFFETT